MLSRSAFKPQQQQHGRGQTLSSPTASDRDEDLVLFTEIQRRERECRAAISEETRPQTPRCYRPLDQFPHLPASSTPIRSYGADELFSSDLGKTDYDWLITPPSTPAIFPVEGDSTTSGASRVASASVMRSVLKTSKLGSSRMDPSSRPEHQSKAVRGDLGLQQQPLNVNSIGSSSSKPAKSALCGVPRASTHSFSPALRHSMASSTQIPSHTPAIEASSSSAASKGIRPTLTQNGCTPLVQAGVGHGRSTCSSRMSTSVKRSPSPSHPSNPPTSLFRCASANRASSLVSRGASSEVLASFLQERPPNLRTSLPERSASNSRSSLGKVSQTEQPDVLCRSRRQSSFPVLARGAASTSASQNGKMKEYINGSLGGRTADMPDGFPVKLAVREAHEKKKAMVCSEERLGDLYGIKPIRSTPMRDIKSIFSSMRDASAVGRNQSKKSLDLTLRHMEICKETPRKLRSFMSSVSKPSMSKQRGMVGKGFCQNGGLSMGSVMDSSMATSSTTSSEHNMSIVIDPEGSEPGDESVSDKGSRSSSAVSQHDLFLLGKERRINNWLRSPDNMINDADIMQIFEQEGLESLSGPESPLISELEGPKLESECFSLDPNLT